MATSLIICLEIDGKLNITAKVTNCYFRHCKFFEDFVYEERDGSNQVVVEDVCPDAFNCLIEFLRTMRCHTPDLPAILQIKSEVETYSNCLHKDLIMLSRKYKFEALERNLKHSVVFSVPQMLQTAEYLASNRENYESMVSNVVHLEYPNFISKEIFTTTSKQIAVSIIKDYFKRNSNKTVASGKVDLRLITYVGLCINEWAKYHFPNQAQRNYISCAHELAVAFTKGFCKA